MTKEQIFKLFEDTTYVRTSGSPAEKQAAERIAEECRKMGLEPHFEEFEVAMSTVHTASLTVDGETVTCRGYRLCGDHDVEAPLHYLPTTDKWELAKCRGKIVITEQPVGYWLYHDLVDAGVLGIITLSGTMFDPHNDIDDKELRPYYSEDTKKLPMVHVHYRDGVELVKRGVKTAHITIGEAPYVGTSQNVIAELPGEIDEWIVLSAHYDSTPLSVGVYDNMTGAIGILGIAEYFTKHPHRRGLRFMWCGSEERGLLGTKAYVTAHQAELSKIVLNINLDMIGTIMGYLHVICTAEEAATHYVRYFLRELGVPGKADQRVHSSDSAVFALNGVPAFSIAHRTYPGGSEIHTRNDSHAVLSEDSMLRDIETISALADRMANAEILPVSRTIPQNVQEKLDYYFFRKRETPKE